jgi:hypothetical protein
MVAVDGFDLPMSLTFGTIVRWKTRDGLLISLGAVGERPMAACLCGHNHRINNSHFVQTPKPLSTMVGSIAVLMNEGGSPFSFEIRLYAS